MRVRHNDAGKEIVCAGGMMVGSIREHYRGEGM